MKPQETFNKHPSQPPPYDDDLSSGANPQLPPRETTRAIHNHNHVGVGIEGIVLSFLADKIISLLMGITVGIILV